MQMMSIVSPRQHKYMETFRNQKADVKIFTTLMLANPMYFVFYLKKSYFVAKVYI